MKLGGVLLTVCAVVAPASGQSTSVPIQATEQSASIHGVVVNASTNQPLGRALVQVEGHSILTAHDGKFEFSGLTGTTTTVTVRKPGFYEGLDANQAATKPVPVGSPDEIQVKLYPEAVITGTFTSANGDPLAQISLQALRQIDDESGSRWIMDEQTNSNADGQFRLTLPGGDYVLQTQYMPERFGTHGAVLPIVFPAAGSNGEGGSGSGASTLRLTSGSEQHLDLHPPVRPSHAVHVQIDGSPEGQFAPQVQVHLANGIVFSPQARRTDRQGEVVVSLPEWKLPAKCEHRSPR